VTDAELSIVLAFVQTMEERRAGGDLLGWRLSGEPSGCSVEVLTVEGRHFSATAKTFDAARKELSADMIRTALDGMPTA
jgi:hypothetical protein